MATSGSIVIAGGGTGGHLMPGLAVARALREAGAEEITFVGTARGLEARLVPAAGFALRLIRIGGLKSGGRRRQLETLVQLPAAVAQSARILRQARARVVLGIGGYASGPVLAAAWLLRVPIVLLEVNAKTGLANRWAARWARASAVNFPETARDFAHAEVTGIPVRPEFFAPWPLAPDPSPLVLVFGGSQGAHALNEAVAAMAAGVDFRILHQTGPRDWEAVAARYAGLGERVRAVAFIDQMAEAMAEAAVVVCRSGASTLGEIAAARKPAILVPLPNSTDQHQLRNAQAFAAAGAAVLLEQAQLTPERLAETLRALLADAPRRAAMAEALGGFAHAGAAEAIARLVLRQRRW
ncbi:MAG: undecaprenyldiphospho-muramoylpentapeptide beta-N-acetylglucosaminyltransferase [Acidobacteria bacterium]|nr:MAG: undecaprenyldiphospho-muramoylpentapeptide beta-N-acetylglucosaminyltransferase [Acidobacteriota bacterium]